MDISDGVGRCHHRGTQVPLGLCRAEGEDQQHKVHQVHGGGGLGVVHGSTGIMCFHANWRSFTHQQIDPSTVQRAPA